MAKTFEHLKWDLYQTKLAVPATAVANMQKHTPIWIEYDEQVSLSYHPEVSWLLERGYQIPKDPDSMMSLSAKGYLGDSYRHPFVIFHEVALAYYDLHAKDGSGLRKKITAAYEQAKKVGNYKSVLRFDGRHLPLPAMASEKEYFAELMESYFLVNDHYPFIRCQLKDQDAAGYEVIAGLWAGNPRR